MSRSGVGARHGQRSSPPAWKREHRNGASRRFRPDRPDAPGSTRGIVVDSVVIGVAGAVFAAIVWNLVSPDVMAEATQDGVRLGITEARRQFGIEVAFTAVTAAAGLIAGAVLMLRHRADDAVTTQVAVAVTGVLGAPAAWQLGRRVVGPGELATRAGEAEPGTLLELPLDVTSYALFGAWPIAALVGGAVVVAILDKPAGPSSADESPHPVSL